jgi:type VI secretion system ImpA family protein
MTTARWKARESKAVAVTLVRLGFVELDALLAPISDEAPAGESLRYDTTFDRIREARREEDASVPQGIWKRELKRADWNEVHRLATSALATRSKDLQITAWLLEAWIHQHGFAGARQGFALLFALCEQYWPELYPLLDGDDASARTLIFEWINEKLPVALHAVPVTNPSDPTLRECTWAERKDALDHENAQRRTGAHGDIGGVDPLLSAVAFDSSAAATPREFHAGCYEDLGAAIDAATALGRLLDERCGPDSPSLTQFISAMSTVREWLETMLASAVPESAIVAEDTTALPASAEAMHGRPIDAVARGGTTAPNDHAATRDAAYRKLAEAAQTLMRIEPHSPTPYLVLRAIAWGGMSLAELMRHFIGSGYDLKSLYTMLGMDEKEVNA